MPDGQQISSYLADDIASAPPPYCPPIALILRGLDTTELEFARARVSVSTGFLRFLICEMARAMPFDATAYAAANPDVEAARLAGDVRTLHEHFVAQGYFERRRPHDLPFESFYYATHYEDLRAAFAPGDAAALRSHFDHNGWQEGRVAVSWQRADAERWVDAARGPAAGRSQAEAPGPGPWPSCPG